MGYVLATGNCVACQRLFSFNPIYVPSSMAITGVKEPICGACMMRINSKRQEVGMEPFYVHPKAYEVADEHEL